METRIDMSEYNGHNIMSVVENNDTKYPSRISFGVAKARIILANIKAIESFVEANSLNDAGPEDLGELFKEEPAKIPEV